MAGGIAIRTVVVLVGARFALTMVSYGSDRPAEYLRRCSCSGHSWPRGGKYRACCRPGMGGSSEVFAVLGMGALLTAIVRAP